MQLDAKQRKEYQKKLAEYRNKYGNSALTDLYKLHKTISAATGDNHFSIKEAYLFDLSCRMETEYSDLKLNDIAEKEGVSYKFILNFFNHYHQPRIRAKNR
jgi:hypothetical protein